uniref:Uncharacterized protein n=1 Tax=Arundo donax TaxID=35708 RepID=A0A0A9DEY1_ARUDO
MSSHTVSYSPEAEKEASFIYYILNGVRSLERRLFYIRNGVRSLERRRATSLH